MQGGWYYYSRDGISLGPVSFEELKRLAASGKLRPSHEVWEMGSTEKKPVSSIPELSSVVRDNPRGPDDSGSTESKPVNADNSTEESAIPIHPTKQDCAPPALNLNISLDPVTFESEEDRHRDSGQSQRKPIPILKPAPTPEPASGKSGVGSLFDHFDKGNGSSNRVPQPTPSGRQANRQSTGQGGKKSSIKVRLISWSVVIVIASALIGAGWQYLRENSWLATWESQMETASQELIDGSFSEAKARREKTRQQIHNTLIIFHRDTVNNKLLPELDTLKDRHARAEERRNLITAWEKQLDETEKALSDKTLSRSRKQLQTVQTNVTELTDRGNILPLLLQRLQKLKADINYVDRTIQRTEQVIAWEKQYKDIPGLIVKEKYNDAELSMNQLNKSLQQAGTWNDKQTNIPQRVTQLKTALQKDQKELSLGRWNKQAKEIPPLLAKKDFYNSDMKISQLEKYLQQTKTWKDPETVVRKAKTLRETVKQYRHELLLARWQENMKEISSLLAKKTLGEADWKITRLENDLQQTKLWNDLPPLPEQLTSLRTSLQKARADLDKVQIALVKTWESQLDGIPDLIKEKYTDADQKLSRLEREVRQSVPWNNKKNSKVAPLVSKLNCTLNQYRQEISLARWNEQAKEIPPLLAGKKYSDADKKLKPLEQEVERTKTWSGVPTVTAKATQLRSTVQQYRQQLILGRWQEKLEEIPDLLTKKRFSLADTEIARLEKDLQQTPTWTGPQAKQLAKLRSDVKQSRTDMEKAQTAHWKSVVQAARPHLTKGDYKEALKVIDKESNRRSLFDPIFGPIRQYVAGHGKQKTKWGKEQEDWLDRWVKDGLRWNDTRKKNTIPSYEKFIKDLPKSPYVAEATKQMVSLKIKKIVDEGKAGKLPPARPIRFAIGRPYAIVNIYNATQYSLVVRYSGTDAFEVTLKPRQKAAVEILIGNYSLSVSAPNAHNVRNYYGKQQWLSADYSSVYYIRTQPAFGNPNFPNFPNFPGDRGFPNLPNFPNGGNVPKFETPKVNYPIIRKVPEHLRGGFLGQQVDLPNLKDLLKGVNNVDKSYKKTVFSKNGKLTRTDGFDRVRRTSYSQSFPVKLEKDKFYRINLRSSAFDTFLRLEDSSGKQLAFNDDDGISLNSRMYYRPTKTDTYRIIVTSFRAGSTGSFSLSVRSKD